MMCYSTPSVSWCYSFAFQVSDQVSPVKAAQRITDGHVHEIACPGLMMLSEARYDFQGT